MNLLLRIWRVWLADEPMDRGRCVAAGKNYEQHAKHSAEALHLDVLVWRWLKDESGNCKQVRDLSSLVKRMAFGRTVSSFIGIIWQI